MKKYIYFTTGIAVILIILFLSDGFVANKNDVVQNGAKIEADLIIDNGVGSPLIFTSEVKQGATVFDLLEKGADKLSLALKTKKYDVGIFIGAIGNKENGQGGNYWLYYVNGEFATVASDKKIIKSGDKVEFKFEKSPF